MAALRTVFMGTPDFAVPCLNMLVNENYDIASVVTQPDRPKGRGQKLAFSPVKEAALAYNLTLWQPAKIKSDEFIRQLEEARPDVIVVVAFGQLLPKKILALPPLGCINVHASLLPEYRGAAPIHWAVINGETQSGITTMYMDAGLDTGDMILKAEIPIAPDDTTGRLHDKLKELGAKLLSETLKLMALGKVPRQAQDNSKATYAPLLTREIEKINWQMPAPSIHNLVRGLNPWPGAYCCHNEKKLKVWQTKVANTDSMCSMPGRIAALGSEGIIVETGKGLLELVEVQPESKRKMKAWECVRGYCLDVGTFLG
ncbi:MAG TPA: methionyl-tRNA formyltransferase [Methylomusa anaerophila]|uniref:Methionyl-tRNA formyltransferase n=1 Tax=Methylomusa anaerophila TaxID=1930071 RepID=A0A348APN1_9FIRM|nr:methionyl-tRNA formyltransferase [Methylomusa anaerophila]BBB93029.1 methionyl-tRNA formyltransferase [Methylomusa anaerophila]HML87137.1 methionyl-tRNA formyltransferase [Methylomusa anaerophila]